MAQQKDHFKAQLYTQFKEAGIVNKLKSTLRKALLDKLDIQPALDQTHLAEPESAIPLVLSKKVIACLISEYLLKNNQEYTVSILLPESNLDRSELLNHDEMLKLLGIEHWQYQGISSIKHNYSVLEALMYMCSTEFKNQRVNVEVQTDDSGVTVAKKLELIEKEYLSKIHYERLGRADSLEQMLQKQKMNTVEMMNSRFQSEKVCLTNEIQARVRREESGRWSNLALMSKKEQEAQYNKKLLDLKSRQKDVLQRLQKRRREVEVEMGQLRNRELQMIKRYQLKQKELQFDFASKTKDLSDKEKRLQGQQLHVRAKKKEYEDCIKMVRAKIIQ